MPTSSPLVLIAAGGTGGHIFPGIAVGRELRARHADTRVEFVGSSLGSGLETRLVPKADFVLHLLPVRPLNVASILARVRGWLALPWSIVRAGILLKRLSPQAVLGIGGYASGPVMFAARLLGIPTVLLEPNTIPGLTNRLLRPLVTHAACAFEVTMSFFGSRARLTGNPVRAEFASLPRTPKHGNGGPLRLLTFGGSQGSKVLSEALVAALRDLPPATELDIVHQTGGPLHASIQEAYARAARPARVVPFIDDMAREFAEADLLLCRAGATTLAEVAVAGKAAILVPLKTSADDHQKRNAQALYDQGAAIMIEEKDLGTLGSQVTSLVRDPQRLLALSAKVATLGRADAARNVADLIAPYLKAA